MTEALQRPWLANGVTALALVVTGYCSVVLVEGRPLLAAVVILAAMVAALAAVGRPSLVAVLAVPCVFLVRRLGPAGGISYSDAVTAVAAAPAIVALARTETMRRLAPALRAMTVYLVALVPSLLLNHSFRSDLEWAHRLVLIGGAILVGAWLVTEKRVIVALRLLVSVSLMVAVASMVYSARHGFGPAYPFQLHKNFVGGVLASVILIAVAAPDSLGVPGRWRGLMIVVLGGGLLASQSRGAILGACVGLLVWVVRSRTVLLDALAARASRRTRRVTALVGAALAVFAYVSVGNQLVQHDSGAITSAEVRVRVEERTREIWRTSPAVGVGLKYFSSGTWGYYGQAANNVIDNELAESGVVGAAGFVLFQLWLLAALWRMRNPLALAALAAVVARLVHGMVDIYWTAGIVTLPFVLVGMGLATGRQEKTADA